MRFVLIFAICTTTFTAVSSAVNIEEYVKEHKPTNCSDLRDHIVSYPPYNSWKRNSATITRAEFEVFVKEKLRHYKAPVLKKYAPYTPLRKKYVTTMKPDVTFTIKVINNTLDITDLTTEATQFTETSTINSETTEISDTTPVLENYETTEEDNFQATDVIESTTQDSVSTVSVSTVQTSTEIFTTEAKIVDTATNSLSTIKNDLTTSTTLDDSTTETADSTTVNKQDELTENECEDRITTNQKPITTDATISITTSIYGVRESKTTLVDSTTGAADSNVVNIQDGYTENRIEERSTTNQDPITTDATISTISSIYGMTETESTPTEKPVTTENTSMTENDYTTTSEESTIENANESTTDLDSTTTNWALTANGAPTINTEITENMFNTEIRSFITESSTITWDTQEHVSTLSDFDNTTAMQVSEFTIICCNTDETTTAMFESDETTTTVNTGSPISTTENSIETITLSVISEKLSDSTETKTDSIWSTAETTDHIENNSKGIEFEDIIKTTVRYTYDSDVMPSLDEF